MSDQRRSRRQPPRLNKRQTTIVVPPTATQTSSFSLYQGNGVNTATDLASTALPTQLVFDSSVVGTPVGAATNGNAATASVSPIFVGTAEPKSVVAASTTSAEPEPSASATDTPSPSSSGSSSKDSNLPIAAIVMGLVAACAIAGLLLFLWYRKRARRRGHSHSRVSSEDHRGPPAGDVLRKLGGTTYEKSDPFSDAHAAEAVDPFADPEKAGGQYAHNRSGSDSFLSLAAPRQPYTHAVSASTGSSASGKARKREMEEARRQDMMALNNLVRALDVKERTAEEEGRDRTSLPPVELFKAALVR